MKKELFSVAKENIPMKWLKGDTSIVIAAAMAILIFVADLFTPSDSAVWFFYLIPLAVTYRASYRGTPLFFAGLCTALLIVDFLFDRSAAWVLIINTSIGASLLWLTAAVLVQRRRAEETLQQSLSLLNATLESTADGILVIGLDGKVVSFNQRFLSLWRIPQSVAESGDDNELLSFVLDQLKEPEVFVSKVKQLYSDPGASSEDVIEFKDGRFFERHSQPQRVADDIVGRVWSFRDVTERKRAEQEIRDREFLLKESQRIGRVGSYDLDIRLEKWTSSEVLDEIFGIERHAEKSLASWNALVHPDQREEMLQYFLRDVVAAKRPFNKEYKIIRARDGSVRWLWGTGELSYDETGAPVRMIGTIQDITERKQTEGTLRKSEEQYRTLIDNMSEGLGVQDKDGLITFMNKRACEMLGYELEEMIGQPASFLFDEENQKILGEQMARRDKGERQSYEIAWRRKDGNRIDTIIAPQPRFDENGELVGSVAVFTDITERKRAEDELRLAEEKYRSIFEGVPMGLYQSTIEGTYLEVNQELVRILGYESPEELIAFTTDLHKEFYVKSGRRAEFIRRIREEGKVAGFESQAYRKDRTIIWVSENARALYDKRGVLVGFEGTTMDITSRRMAGESMQRLLRAVEQTHDVVFMTDMVGRIIYVNPAFEQTYGYTRNEAYGNTPRILKSGLQDAAFYARLWDTILSGQNIRAELINKTKDGQVVIMESTVSPVFDSDVGLSGFIAVQRDVTSERKGEEERKGLEEQLFQAQKLESIGTLAGGIAHDFNNVLGIILGYATILQHTFANNENATKGFDAIHSAVQRGADLVRQILMFARKSEASFMPFDVNFMITELKKMIEETFPKTVTVSTSLDPQLPAIRADRTQMHQTLLNLFVNARDAMPEGGALSIRTRKATWDELREHVPDPIETDFIEIAVSDTGTGMDEATKRKIFEPFFTTKEQGKGTGLGLAVVYGIIKSHNGYVDVKSVPGEGTTFSLYFPVLSSLEERSDRPDEAPTTAAGGTETILVIEDEKTLIELMKASLESKGYSVITAPDGAEAVKLFKKHHEEIALVISDLGLPKLDGTRVFNEFKKINPRVKVLIASGYIDPGVKSGFLKAGARGFLQKPYALPDILKKVRETLDAE